MTQDPLDADTGSRPWREIGDGVFVRAFPEFRVNAGLVVGERAALVIDTRASVRQGLELRAAIGRMTPLPQIVVNTHHHYDHVFGNAAFATAEIWGHERCVARMLEEAETIRAALARAMPERAVEYAETPTVPPNRTLHDRATIDLGGRTVEFVHFGRGHTDNDVVVIVPDAGVVFAGDLVEEGAPPSFEDSYPMDWPGTLGRLLRRADGQIVPGHGGVVDRDFVEGQIGELDALATLARRVRLKGGSAEDALPDSPFTGEAGGKALERAFAQLGGEI
jgi:glyoxylase-like metal-dependent hydrolase (beta-lactamase superfamily II)